MKIDLSTDASIQLVETDVAIIGSGPAGTSLASRLTRDCVVIESGGPELDIKNHWMFHSVNAGDRTKVDSLRVRGIGGASLRWTGRCVSLDPYDFEDRPWIAQTSWPVGYDTLTPWFDRAAELMDLQSPDFTGRYAAAKMDEAMRADGRWRPVLWRNADNKDRGMLRFGDHFASEFAGERRHLYYYAHCTRIIADGSRVKALLVQSHNGRSIFVRARHFVIAAGCVESARLLLDTQRENPALLGAVSPWLGRGFNQHLRVDAGTIALSKRFERLIQRQMTVFRRGGVTLGERGFGIDPAFARTQEIGNASLVLRYGVKGRGSVRNFLERAGRRVFDIPLALSNPHVSVEIDTEQTVTRESRIELDENLDPLGRPRARVHWTISKTDCRTAMSRPARLPTS